MLGTHRADGSILRASLKSEESGGDRAASSVRTPRADGGLGRAGLEWGSRRCSVLMAVRQTEVPEGTEKRPC